MLTRFANQLNEKYNIVLAPPIFFEFPTVGRLAKYLAKEHGDIFARHFYVQSTSDTVVQKRGSKKARQTSISGVRPRLTNTCGVSQSAQPTVTDSVAIVGISGIFPQALDVHEFWENLVQGKDCIERHCIRLCRWTRLRSSWSMVRLIPSGKSCVRLYKMEGYILNTTFRYLE